MMQSDDHTSALHHLRIVLVRPRIAGNIGAVARCMENFAVGPLVLVEPEISPASREAMQRSTHGEHRLHSARVANSIAEALEGTIYAVATSRRPGPVHQADDLTPRQMGEVAPVKPVNDVGRILVVISNAVDSSVSNAEITSG